MKSDKEIRDAKIAAVKMEMEYKKNQTYTAEMEIAEIRKKAMKDDQAAYILAETNKRLAGRSIASNELMTQAQMEEKIRMAVNEKELVNFKNMLEQKKAAALSFEQKKNLELAQIQATASAGGQGGPSDAAKNLAIQQENAKYAEMKAQLTEHNLWTAEMEKAHKDRLLTIEMEHNQKKSQYLITQKQQLAAALGTSPEAKAAALEAKKMEDQMELEMLRQKYAGHQELETMVQQTRLQQKYDTMALEQEMEKKQSDEKIRRLMLEGKVEQ